jgi:hypothetical protein
MVIMHSPKACVYNTPVVIILIVYGNYVPYTIKIITAVLETQALGLSIITIYY